MSVVGLAPTQASPNSKPRSEINVKKTFRDTLKAFHPYCYFSFILEVVLAFIKYSNTSLNVTKRCRRQNVSINNCTASDKN